MTYTLPPTHDVLSEMPEQFDPIPVDEHDEFDTLPEAPIGPKEESVVKRSLAKGRPFPLSDLWDEEFELVQPTLIPVADGLPLLYPGESHVVIGPGGTGKSWFCYFAVLQAVRYAMSRAAILDYESNPRTVVSRLKALGMTREEAGRVYYWRTSANLAAEGDAAKGTGGKYAWWSWLEVNAIDFIVIDSVARSMGAGGFAENSADDFIAWDRQVIEPLVKRSITTLMIDHTGHAGPNGDKEHARGSSAKKDTVTGAAFLFMVKEAWDRYTNGWALLKVLKDREGARRKDTLAARMDVTVGDGGKDVKIVLSNPEPEAPKTPSVAPGVERSPFMMEEVSKYLSKVGAPQSGRQVEEGMVPKRNSGQVRAALKDLIAEGYVLGESGPRNAVFHTHVVPFRAVSDPGPQGGPNATAAMNPFLPLETGEVSGE